MMPAISRISGSSMPCVAGPGVPTRRPEGVEGGFGGAWQIGDSADASFRYLIDARLNFIF